MEELDQKLYMKILKFDETRRKEWERDRQPYSVLFELTARCNMNCIHCYLKEHHIDKDYISFNRVKDIIDILYDNGILFLTFTGGDVFMRPDFMDIYMYAKRKGFFVEIFTNGELMTENDIEILKRYPPLMIDISLYGADEQKYFEVTGRKNAFDKVINNCKKLRDAKIRFSLKTPLLKQTIDELSKMEKIANDLGVVFAYAFELIPTIDGDISVIDYQLDYEIMLQKEFSDFNKLTEGEQNIALSSEYNKFIDGQDKNPLFICNVARNSFLIDYTGKICPCMKLRHRGKELTNDNFAEIWEEYSEYGKMKASREYKCSKCKARFQCSVCPAQMDLLYGDFEYVNSELCKVAHARYAFYDEKKSIDEALEYLNK